ncbi:MAG: hypothetical protein HQL19_02005 [Candidatus Omnitrophica bacterium]|nr:hypothetical protein [Candidatus Omnitrophota bacterium]
MVKKLIAIVLSLFLLMGQAFPAAAMDLSWLPVPGTMVRAGADLRPSVFRGIRVDAHDPFHFQFLIEEGQKPLNDEETGRSLRYFLTALTVPEKDIWVNLSPVESGRIVPDVLADTEMGRDLLGQDYILKQISASLLYPESALGKEFWQKVYARAGQELGITDVPMDVNNRVWITPGEILVQERNGVAVIAKATLKVMLETDYHVAKADAPQGDVSASPSASDEIMKNVFRAIVIPELEREVNTNEQFSRVRQVYHALILAAWYKRRFKDGTLSQAYVDQGKTPGIAVADRGLRRAIYERYLDAYRKGAFNYIREEADLSGEVLPRKYFSGGVDIGPQMEKSLKIDAESAMSTHDIKGPLRVVNVQARKFASAKAAEEYIVTDPKEIGNKGRNLQDNKELLGGYIPEFNVMSSRLYQDYKNGKVDLTEVVRIARERLMPFLEQGGTFAVRPSGVINMPGMLPTIKGVSSVEDIVRAILKIYTAWGKLEDGVVRKYRSFESSRAQMNKLSLKGLSEDFGPAVILQREVFAEGEGASGVFVSRDPDTGEGIVSGTFGMNTPPENIRNGDDARLEAVSTDMDSKFPAFSGNGGLYRVLEEVARKLERKYAHPVEVEFMVDHGRLYIVQVNMQDVHESLKLTVLTQMADEGIISRPAIALPAQVLFRKVGRLREGASVEAIAHTERGLSPGAVDGVLAFDMHEAVKMRSLGPVILVSEERNEEGVLQALVSGDIQGLITLYGDYHMHNARIAREGLIPGISLAGAGAEVVEENGVKVLKMAGRTFKAGDRLAITAESHIEDQGGHRKMMHSGRIVLPRQKAPVVVTEEVPIEDLYFDVNELKSGIRQKYEAQDLEPLVAAHAMLKAYLDRNIVKGKEANKLEAATNTLHEIIDKRPGIGGSQQLRVEEFVPLAQGFGAKFQFPQIRTVDDLDAVFDRVKSLIERYTAMPPAEIKYSNFRDGKKETVLFSKELPLEFSIEFKRADINWEYENPALWAFVNKAAVRIRYLNEDDYNLGKDGPWADGYVFTPDMGDPAPEKQKIRVKASANIFNGQAARRFTFELATRSRKLNMKGVYAIDAGDLTQVIRQRIAEVKKSYPLRQDPTKVEISPGEMRAALTQALMPTWTVRSGIISLSSDNIHLYGLDGKPFRAEKNVLSRIGEGFIWRWQRQDLGYYVTNYTASGEPQLVEPNQGGVKESVFFVRLLQSLLTHKKGAAHYAVRSEEPGLGLHNKGFVWQVNQLSWIAIDHDGFEELLTKLAGLEQKYDLSGFASKDAQDNIQVDLEGALMLMFQAQGHSEQELMDLVKDSAEAVGGIDLDISDRALGEGNALPRVGAAAKNASEDITGLVPVVLSQTPVVDLNAFVGAQ